MLRLARLALCCVLLSAVAFAQSSPPPAYPTKPSLNGGEYTQIYPPIPPTTKLYATTQQIANLASTGLFPGGTIGDGVVIGPTGTKLQDASTALLSKVILPTGNATTDYNNVNTSIQNNKLTILGPGTFNICQSIIGPGHEMVVGYEINNFNSYNGSGISSNTVIQCSGTPSFTVGDGILNPGSYSLYQGITVNGQFSGVPAATGTGYFSGTTFTVSSTISGTWAIGQYLVGRDIVPGTKIVSGTGPFTINISQTLGSSGSPINVTVGNGYSCIDVENTVWVTLNNDYVNLCDNGIDAGAVNNSTNVQGLHVTGGHQAYNAGYGIFGGTKNQGGGAFEDGNISGWSDSIGNQLGGMQFNYLTTTNIVGARIEDNQGAGIEIDGGNNNTITGNQFDRNGVIRSGYSTAGAPNLLLYNVASTAVTGNIFSYPFWNFNTYGPSTCGANSYNVEVSGYNASISVNFAGNSYDYCANYTFRYVNFGFVTFLGGLISDLAEYATGPFYDAATATAFRPLMPPSATPNCSNGSTPATCGSSSAGSVAIPAGATQTLVVDTTAVTANSQIKLTVDESASISGTTCNTTASTLGAPIVTARTAGTSFTIEEPSTTSTNPVCVDYVIVN